MIREWNGHKPKIHPSAFIHETAEIIGRVTIEKDASVWPMCVLRGDVDEIVIGEGTNIQDNTVIHANEGAPTIMGKRISVGHSVVLHGCKVQDDCIVGMGSIVLDHAEIGTHCIIGAGAVVSPRTKIPANSMVLGVPGKVARLLKPEEVEHIHWNAKEYYKLSDSHRKTSRRIF